MLLGRKSRSADRHCPHRSPFGLASHQQALRTLTLSIRLGAMLVDPLLHTAVVVSCGGDWIPSLYLNDGAESVGNEQCVTGLTATTACYGEFRAVDEVREPQSCSYLPGPILDPFAVRDLDSSSNHQAMITWNLLSQHHTGSVPPSDPSAILFPVRSNARSLVAGASVATVRRRLKLASLLHDVVLLELGHVSVQAGPSGGSSFWHEASSSDDVRWQTATERSAAKKAPFVFLVGVEESLGVPASRMVPIIQSETAIRWEATLQPFSRELPAECDWIEWVYTDTPRGHAARLADDWSRRDARNAALTRAIPEEFVRRRVVENANRDLVNATLSGCAASQDSLHQRVVARRFDDTDGNWRLVGFALPILVPDVGQLSWEAIAALRRQKGIERLRAVISEIEAETLEVATSGGDLERAVHRIAEARLTEVASQTDSLVGTGKRTAIGFVVGLASGVATAGLTGPVGMGASSALGSAVGAVLDAAKVVRDRRARQWVGVLNRLRDS